MFGFSNITEDGESSPLGQFTMSAGIFYVLAIIKTRKQSNKCRKMGWKWYLRKDVERRNDQKQEKLENEDESGTFDPNRKRRWQNHKSLELRKEKSDLQDQNNLYIVDQNR